ncbi:cytoplasmic 60S subunit biogenesis factor ZNF622 [Anastrepha obliqua]|uniref:cytoplasmic 60S subunit biogenesis factor ZNF622 n=1 Tax=Anastrepha obliqua TaxID=95512 RepID=UPI00240A7994|nr:cytoplasmic 60S subunit biogenesis factor ZNF622 [Anastrepha obliqua]
MSAHTCISCSVRFSTADMQRDHYKTDWHRYNLKRRVAELPPVTAEAFQDIVLRVREEKATEELESQMSFYCKACRKQFSTQKAHDNHLNSKKHKDNLVRFESEHKGKEVEITKKSVVEQRPHPALAAAAQGKGKFALQRQQENEQDDDDEYEDLDDDENFEVIEEEMTDHMDSDEWEKLAENPLTEKDCLFCTHVSEDMIENLKHMSVAHSFFVPDTEYCTDLEGLLYYLGEKVANYFICLSCNDRGKTFYSLDAVRKHMIDKGHCQMLHEGIALAEYADYYDYSSSYPDHQEGMDVDEEVVPDVLDGDEYKLVLPSGVEIGHRSLLRYYKQHLNPNRAPAPKKSNRRLHKVLSEYRALGWSKTQQQVAARKARDLHVMKRAQAKWQMKLGCRANKLQKHYRAQIMF